MDLFPGEVRTHVSSVGFRYEEHCNVIYAETQWPTGCKTFMARMTHAGSQAVCYTFT